MPPDSTVKGRNHLLAAPFLQDAVCSGAACDKPERNAVGIFLFTRHRFSKAGFEPTSTISHIAVGAFIGITRYRTRWDLNPRAEVSLRL